jgi:hypothetical protein
MFFHDRLRRDSSALTDILNIALLFIGAKVKS